MDKATRNSIQRATQAARGLLEDAFHEQLEGTYDILLDGTISEQPGSHLSERQKVTREKLVAAVAHKRSTGLKAKEAVDAYLREAAFTTLNRFVALKMLEARQLVQECVSKGEDSSGFKEFTALAPGLVAVEDKGYRLYIETLFDEIGQEVKVLFDRRDVASLLWPDRQTLLEFLGILNAPELSSVWAEDETIGWVYQYFNGDEERRQMRAESQAPRNSRELAVRNQFFTPRYVVQFLTDNTLGRTWYEMMQGETKLAHLDYLVRRPNEDFLAEDESAPESEVDESELSQEELLQQSVYVPFRAQKDPRDLRILDPACGSGHFLLYAFELLVSIYEEAWSDTGAAAFVETDTTLRDDFESLDALRRAMPQLILRHNLHGVDIDPRAAQIAALALWMRAQRAYNQFDVSRAERPPITKTNIVVAEPMPGDAGLVEEFASSLKPPVLGDLFKKMVEEMKLAGELGSLLKIEESIANAVTTAREAFADRQNTLSRGFLPGFEPAQGELDLSGIDDDAFFAEAESKMMAALASFAESAVGSAGIRRQLFAGDAAQGVAFIELMRQRFDVLLMNPPFGASAEKSKKYLAQNYRLSKTELAGAFVERAIELTTSSFGAIHTRSLFLAPGCANWRAETRKKGFLPTITVDFEGGVLDAMVETSAAVYSGGSPNTGIFLRLTNPAERAKRFFDCIRSVAAAQGREDVFVRALSDFQKIPLAPYAYWVSRDILSLFVKHKSFEPHHGVARTGLATLDNFRFLRSWWEVDVSQHENSFWVPLAKGGVSWPFFAECDQVLNWKDDGKEVKVFVESKVGHVSRKIQATEYYFRPGVTWIQRTNLGFCPRALPADCIFDTKGPTAFPLNAENLGPTLAIFASQLFQDILELQVSAHSYHPGCVQRSPMPALSPSSRIALGLLARDGHAWAQLAADNETFRHFTSPNLLTWIKRRPENASLDKVVQDELNKICLGLAEVFREIEKETHKAYGLPIENCPEYSARLDRAAARAQLVHKEVRDQDFLDLLSWALGIVFGRFNPIETKVIQELTDHDPFSASSTVAGHSRVILRLQRDRASRRIAVDDLGHKDDLVSQVTQQLALALDDDFEVVWATLEDRLRQLSSDPRDYYSRQFFSSHVKVYSKSRRKAPIYWQLAIPSATYSVWCYYHRLTRDTFFRVANDYVTPKVDHEERKLNALRQEAGTDPTSKQRKAIDTQETFVAELRAFKTEVNRIAPLWNPNLNDGVIINFAPLWRLVPQHKPWQKECKKVWDKLVKGDYDWAHLAMHLWPERVVPKCKDDRSLAIAHELEDDFWVEADKGKWQKRQVSGDRVEELVAERASTAVKAALDELVSAPAPSGVKKRRARRGGGGAA